MTKKKPQKPQKFQHKAPILAGAHGKLTITFKPRPLGHFCDVHHQAAYNNWLADLEKVAKNEADINLANATISVWETMRKASKRCYYCSAKLTSARRSTIG